MKVYGSGPFLGSEPHKFTCFASKETDVEHNQVKPDQIHEKPTELVEINLAT